jgi:probable phosphoglycerate mutase
VRLILIRHGQTTANIQHRLDTAVPGANLSPVGQAQARQLAQRLGGGPIEAIWTSDLVRAQETAAPLAEALGLTPVVHPGLREIQAGDLEGLDWTPYVAVLTGWLTDPTRRMPGSESGVEFLARFNAALAALVAENHACAAVVSHGGALRVWLTTTLGADLPVAEGAPWFLENTACVILDDAAGRWQVEYWGGTTPRGDPVALAFQAALAEPAATVPPPAGRPGR